MRILQILFLIFICSCSKKTKEDIITPNQQPYSDEQLIGTWLQDSMQDTEGTGIISHSTKDRPAVN